MVHVLKTARQRQILKLHAVVGYSRKYSALVVFSASVTGWSIHDATQFKPLLSNMRAKGEPLLADSAYDARSNVEFARERGFRPVIKPRSYELYGFIRREMAEEFRRSHELYRQRSVAEAFFAGLENRYDSRVRCKLIHTQISSILLIAIAHNMRTYARVRTMAEEKILFILIYSTNPRIKEEIFNTSFKLLQQFSEFLSASSNGLFIYCHRF